MAKVLEECQFQLPYEDEGYLHQGSDEDPEKHVHNGECRNGERNKPDSQVVPIERGPWVKTHSTVKAGNGVQSSIIGRNPGEPTECRQCLEYETREKVPAEYVCQDVEYDRNVLDTHMNIARKA